MALEENPYDDPLNLRQTGKVPDNIFTRMQDELSRTGGRTPERGDEPRLLPPAEELGGPGNIKHEGEAAAQKSQPGPPAIVAIYPAARYVRLHPEAVFQLTDAEVRQIVAICLNAFIRAQDDRAREMAQAHGIPIHAGPMPPAPPQTPPKRRRKKA